MKTSHLALSLLFVSCTVAAPNTGPVFNKLPAQQPVVIPPPTPADHDHDAPASLNPLQAVERLQQAAGQITRAGERDGLRIRVSIQRPSDDFSTQKLELSRIQNLRAWVEGPGLEERILNLNEFVAVSDQNQQTELVISEVPRGKNRVVTVQGYDASAQGNPPEVSGATLKAVYSSPENSTEVSLLFTWRSTAFAEIIETLLSAIENAPKENTGDGNSAEELQTLLDNLDETALNTFLDAVVFGTNPTDGSTYRVHPDRLDPDKITQILIAQQGQIPTQSLTDPVPTTYLDNMADLNLKVQTPQKVPFSNSQIQVQITDPASNPITLTVGSDNAQIPQVVPGQWEAIVKLDGLNGGVSARATLSVDSDGNAVLTEGTSDNPIILPPVITAIDKSSASVGDTIVLTGDGFDPDKTKNSVKFGDVEAEVVFASATGLVIKVPAGASGSPQITVTSQNKTSNYADVTIVPKITNMSSLAGNPGSQVTLTVTGFNPRETGTLVRFNGSAIDVTPDSVTTNTITVTVPADATTGGITLSPSGLSPLISPVYTIGFGPTIIQVNPSSNISANQQITVTGVNILAINSIVINGATVTNYNVAPGANGQPDTITLTVPSTATAGVGTLQINTPIGSASSPVTVLAAPTITTITAPDPNQPSPTLVLSGGNYLPVTEVSIGGVVLPTTAYTIDSNNQITITTLPTNPVLGPVKVTNAAGSATASITYKDVVNFIGNTATALRTKNNNTQVSSPHGINVDAQGNIYVADLSNRIHKFVPSPTDPSVVTVPSGWPLGITTAGYVDGAASVARFSSPEDLANDAQGNIYVADTSNDAIRKITEVGGVITVTTIARVPGPEGIEVSRDGKIYVTGNNPPNPSPPTIPIIGSYVFRIDNTSPDTTASAFTTAMANYSRGNVSSIVNAVIVAGGPKAPSRTLTTTTLANARFNHLEGLGIDAQGRIYVAEVDDYWIRRIDEANNQVTLFADLHPCYTGASGCQYTVNNPGIVAHEIRVDRQGNVFVPSPSQAPAVGVYVISPEGKFSFIAGSALGVTGLNDGNPLSSSTFSSPRGIDFGPDGSLYVADTGWGIRKIDRYHPVSNLQMP